MLKGKFFAGLPPGMVERDAGPVRNRLETHFYWPNDTTVETAVEGRLKRRNSLQPTSHKLNSNRDCSSDLPSVDEIDTKQRFHREFAKSSINFSDNLNEVSTRPGKTYHRPIAEKPTAIKLPANALEATIDPIYATVRRHQSYRSKIRFYDADCDAEDTSKAKPQPLKIVDSKPSNIDTKTLTNNMEPCNNFNKLKMDYNNKRDVQLNTKNSPKLQVKRNARALSEENEMEKVCNNKIDGKKQQQYINKVKANTAIIRSPTASPESQPRQYLSQGGDLLKSNSWNNSTQSAVQQVNSISTPYSVSIAALNSIPTLMPNAVQGYLHNSIINSDRKNFSKHLLNSKERINNLEQELVSLRVSNPLSLSTLEKKQNLKHSKEQLKKTVSEHTVPTLKKNESISKSEFNKQDSPMPLRSRQHLVSSLCFQNGAVMGNNELNTSSSTPTTAKRSARSAATRRVSVGLPD